MKTYIFAGFSDDTFGEYAITKDDYDNCASGKPIAWILSTPDGNGFVISGQYSPNQSGGWSIAVEPVEADSPCNEGYPYWPMRFANPIGHEIRPAHYSMVLEIDAPDDAVLVCMERKVAGDDE